MKILTGFTSKQVFTNICWQGRVEVFYLRTEMVVRKPEFVYPDIGRVYPTSLRVNGAKVSAAEVWLDQGDDGHIEMYFAGFAMICKDCESCPFRSTEGVEKKDSVIYHCASCSVEVDPLEFFDELQDALGEEKIVRHPSPNDDE